jgi:hypothetical protein
MIAMVLDALPANLLRVIRATYANNLGREIHDCRHCGGLCMGPMQCAENKKLHIMGCSKDSDIKVN